MARTDRIDLRAFQQELSERLKHKTAAQVGNLRLALESADAHWLVRLGDTGEVLPVPTIVPVPMTRSWFIGIANVRGALYGVIDFTGFLTGRESQSQSQSVKAAAQTVGSSTRLVLLGSRFPEIRAGLLVERVLGLRNLTDFKAAPEVASNADGSGSVTNRRWSDRGWFDGDGTRWRELDIAAMTADPEFMQVGA